MGQGPQKADHRGNFFMTPRRVLNSVAWRYSSFRDRAVLQIFQSKHNGYNNGKIALGIHELGRLLGNQNHGANARSVASNIEKGFLECTSDADRAQSKVRCYRVTFISTGSERTTVPATHEYEDWRPAAHEKPQFGGARKAPPEPVSGAVSTREVKVSGADIAPTDTVIRGVAGHAKGAETAPLIDNHSTGFPNGLQRPTCLSGGRSLPLDIGVSMDDLRLWSEAVVAQQGHGSARRLAKEANVPEPTLSRFRSGRNLPSHHRLRLQEACGRALPFILWAKSRETQA